MDEIVSSQEQLPEPIATAAAAPILVKQGSSPGPAVTSGVAEGGKSSHELRALHGLRFLAAFCILFAHACSWLANFRDDQTILRFGDFFTAYAMPLFFVLSGFVIHYNYSRLFSTMQPLWAAS